LVSYYRGKVREWVVVNEPYILPYRPIDIFYQTIGVDYLEIAFRAAREADPSATLIYNDSDNHTPAGITTNLTRKNVRLIKTKGLVDVVGMQMHLDGARPPARKEIIATMKSYELPVYVTEMDVNMKDVAATEDEKYRLQAKIYREAVEACLESGVCRSITFWEVGDKYSWAEWPKDAPHASPNADMTLFDDNLEPKPAYYAIRDVLSHKL
jgi:endo-1,4-beta-xylanase